MKHNFRKWFAGLLILVLALSIGFAWAEGADKAEIPVKKITINEKPAVLLVGRRRRWRRRN